MIRPIFWNTDTLKIVNQTKLPQEYELIEINDHLQMAQAIKKLAIRGAPAIGIAAAFGLVVGLRNFTTLSQQKFLEKLDEIYNILLNTRPTAVNLEWALQRMKSTALANRAKSNQKLIAILTHEAQTIHREDIEFCQQIGRNGADLIPSQANILTHCNAGGLATGGLGTALGVIITAHRQEKDISVFVDETRPLLQGARLTMWELQEEDIACQLNIDSAAAYLMAEDKIDVIVVGADRIAQNGDVANKIGTYSLAVLAKYHDIPFLVAAPTSTIDKNIATGTEIPIEFRSDDEITKCGGKNIAPQASRTTSPAFDITPVGLINNIITEEGIYPADGYKDL